MFERNTKKYKKFIVSGINLHLKCIEYILSMKKLTWKYMTVLIEKNEVWEHVDG
jgi:hypothetical protein